VNDYPVGGGEEDESLIMWFVFLVIVGVLKIFDITLCAELAREEYRYERSR
jgi:hypothetical protein